MRVMVRVMCGQQVIDRRTKQMDMLGLKKAVDGFGTANEVR